MRCCGRGNALVVRSACDGHCLALISPPCSRPGESNRISLAEEMFGVLFHPLTVDTGAVDGAGGRGGGHERARRVSRAREG